jgi:integral membrane protein
MEDVKTTITRWYHQMDGIFVESEAWSLFKTLAILETIGWTMLIIGIMFKVNHWPLADVAIGVGGSAHGMIVIAYMLVVLFAHRSMGWSVWKFTVAELINAIPYAVLVFEIWAARQRNAAQNELASVAISEND